MILIYNSMIKNLNKVVNEIFYGNVIVFINL